MKRRCRICGSFYADLTSVVDNNLTKQIRKLLHVSINSRDKFTLICHPCKEMLTGMWEFYTHIRQTQMNLLRKIRNKQSQETNCCRLCGCSYASVMPLFNDSLLLKQITVFFGIEISKGDMLPTIICKPCYDTINNCWKFYLNVQEIQEILLKETETQTMEYENSNEMSIFLEDHSDMMDITNITLEDNNYKNLKINDQSTNKQEYVHNIHNKRSYPRKNAEMNNTQIAKNEDFEDFVKMNFPITNKNIQDHQYFKITHPSKDSQTAMLEATKLQSSNSEKIQTSDCRNDKGNTSNLSNTDSRLDSSINSTADETNLSLNDSEEFQEMSNNQSKKSKIDENVSLNTNQCLSSRPNITVKFGKVLSNTNKNLHNTPSKMKKCGEGSPNTNKNLGSTPNKRDEINQANAIKAYKTNEQRQITMDFDKFLLMELRQNSKCVDCQRLSKNGVELINHYQTDHKGGPKFECDYCQEILDDYIRFIMHIEGHKKRQYKKNLDGNTQNNEESFACICCDETFKTNAEMFSHERSKFLEKFQEFQCKKCLKVFDTKQCLGSHRSLHEKLGDFKCTHCDRSFLEMSDWKIHTRAHTIKFSDTCRICGLDFATTPQLKTHGVLHSSYIVKRQHHYYCAVCGCGHPTRNLANMHILTHKLKKNITTLFSNPVVIQPKLLLAATSK